MPKFISGRGGKPRERPSPRAKPLLNSRRIKPRSELPAPVSGKFVKILKSEGEAAEINEVIALIEEGAAGTVATESLLLNLLRKPQKPELRLSRSTKLKKGLLLCRQLAKHRLNGVSPDAVAATGPGQRLLKEDVLKHVEQQQAAAPQPPAATPPGGHGVPDAVHPDEQLLREEEAVPMSPIRRRIAERLVKAQHTAALLTTFNEVDMTEVIALRKEYQEAFTEEYGVKLGFMSFFVKATIDALKRSAAERRNSRTTILFTRTIMTSASPLAAAKVLSSLFCETPSG